MENQNVELKQSNENFCDPNEQQKCKNKKKQILWVGLFMLAVVVLEYLTRDLSKVFTMSYFGSTDKSRCQYLSYYEFYHFSGRYLLLFLILSYVNVYAALNYMFLDCFVVFLNGFLRFFYLDDRPYWKHPEYSPCFCATDYGNPSTTGVDSFIMFAAFYKAFTYNSKSKVFTWTMWLICALNVGYIYIIRMMQNVHYLNQLLYGLAIGLALYYIVFEILEIDFGNPKQFMAIFNRWILFSSIILLCIILITLIHLNLHLPTPSLEEIAMIEQNCKMNNLFSLDNESYSKSVRILEFIGSLIGVYVEYSLIFKCDEDKFIRYNIKSEKDMYKHTSAVVSFLRFVMFYITQRYLFDLMMLGKANYDTFQKASQLYGLVVQQSIPTLLHGFLIFFVLKAIIPFLMLSNESIWLNEKKVINEDVQEDAKKSLLPKENK